MGYPMGPLSQRCYPGVRSTRRPYLYNPNPPRWSLQEDGLKEFEGNVKKALEAKGITEGFLVTVDYHG